MTIRPVYESLGQTFREFIFAAPRYQRGYTWDEPEVQDFLGDLAKCFQARRAGSPREHFLGGVVGVDEPIPGSVSRRCQLIDGQQRVTTFVIFARALELTLQELIESSAYRSHRLFLEESATAIRGEFLRIRIQVHREYKDEERYVPSEPDRPYFSAFLHQHPTEAARTRESHSRLYRAFELSLGKIKELLEAERTRQKKVDAIAELSDVLRNDLAIILILTSDSK